MKTLIRALSLAIVALFQVFPIAEVFQDFDPQPEPPKLPNLAHWWRGENDARDSAGTAHGTLGAGISFGPGRIIESDRDSQSRAFVFDGTGTRESPPISFGTEAGNFGTSDFTIAFFFRTPSIVGMHALGKRYGCAHWNFWNFTLRDGVVGAEIDEDSQGKNYKTLGADDLAEIGQPNAWHHMALVRQGTELRLYLNGRLADNRFTDGVVPFNNTDPLLAGLGPCTSSPFIPSPPPPFKGELDDIRIYHAALDAQQVMAVAGYTHKPSIFRQPQGAVFNFPFSNYCWPPWENKLALKVTAKSLANKAAAPFTYQWFRNGVPIPNATEAVHCFGAIDNSSEGIFTVQVRNAYGSATSRAARVDVLSDNQLAAGPNHWWPGNGSGSDWVAEIEGGTEDNYQVGGVHAQSIGDMEFGLGKVGGAFQFKDVGERNGVQKPHLRFSGLQPFARKDFTIHFWVRTSHLKRMILLGQRSACSHQTFWEIGVNASGVPSVEIDFVHPGAPPYYFALAKLGPAPHKSIADGAWHHVALVREGRDFRFYLDGRLDAFASTTPAIGASDGVLPFLTLDPMRAGFSPCADEGQFGFGAWPFIGSMDEIKVFYTALSELQIKAAAAQQTVHPALNPKATSRAFAGLAAGNGRFQWRIADAERRFDATDLVGVNLETSTDLKFWTVVPGALRLGAEGQIEIADPAAYQKRESYYRIAFRDPARETGTGGMIPLSEAPAELLEKARAHLEAFVGEPGARLPDETEWVGAQLGPTARHIYDPAGEGGIVPCFLELKVLSPSGEDRGYILMSLENAEVVEFSTEGPTKTERALGEIPGQNPRKFMRFNRSFLAMEDSAGRLLGTWGTWPVLPEGGAPSDAVEHSGEYDSETQTRQSLPPVRNPLIQPPGYAQLRSSFANNPVRAALRGLRASALSSRLGLQEGLLQRHTMLAGEIREFLPGQILSAVRVDADEDEDPALKVQMLREGFRAEALKAGTELVRVRHRDGKIETHLISVAGRLAPASAACPPVVTKVWSVGTGWHGDQRQYKQPKSEDWCPAVGCGPVALAMLYGWWDTNGVPSAFYRLNSGFGEANNFRFRFNSIRHSDASKTMTEGYLTNLPSPGSAFGYVEAYIRSTEELVVHDLHKLCNTFCVNGQGATYPDQLVSAAVEYIDRVVKNHLSPHDEFGENFVTAHLKYSYTDGYWAGMTDWQGGGVKVAGGIKEGRPGIVGLGDIVWDLHYALAYAYKRLDYFEGCGPTRELVDRRRWFKCNMGWGSGSPPEWHDAESVWFGLTAKLSQKKLPQ